MNILKKLVFAPFLVISVIAVVIFADQLLADPLTMLIGFQSSSFYTLAFLSVSMVAASLFFALIVTLSLSWEIPIFVAGFSSLIPLMMIQHYPVNVILSLGFFVSFMLGLLMLLQKLKSYLTFSPKQLLAPTIGLVTLLFSLTISIAAYQDAAVKIEKEGFTVPDSLIQAAMQLSGAKSLTSPGNLVDPNVQGVETTASDVPTINLGPEQIKYIQQNPKLLEQFNITPEQFNAFVKSQKNGTATKKPSTGKTASPAQNAGSDSTNSPDLVTSLVKNQLNESLKPYSAFIAPLVGILLFSTVTFGNYVLGFFVPLLLWMIFSIMEKTGFVHFVKEMREVKKLVV